MMCNTDNLSAREGLKVAAQVLYDAWIDDFRRKYPNQDPEGRCWEWVWGRKLSPSEIRLEVLLNATNNVFKFGLTEKQSNSNNLQFITEQRLDEQNTLIVNQYALYICNPSGVNDTTFDLCTYPNTQIFTGAAGDPQALKGTLYMNGNYSLMVNNDNVIPFRSLKNHLHVPRTQQTAALGANSPEDEFVGSKMGFITQEANLLLIGNKGYIPQINLKSNLAITGTTYRAVLWYSGVLAQNSTILS